jgi:ABC-type multidrug transport system fused ATPase/permease subunit
MRGERKTADLAARAWPVERLAEALEHLALAQGLPLKPDMWRRGPATSPPVTSAEAFADWVVAAAGHLGLEAEPEEVTFGRVAETLRRTEGCLIPLADGGAPRFLAVFRRRGLFLLDPSLSRHAISARDLEAALRGSRETPLWNEMLELARACGLKEDDRVRGARALLAARLADAPVGVWWHLSASLRMPLWRQARSAGLVRRLAILLGAYLAQHVLWILAWFLIARTALRGQEGAGLFLAWCLVLLTIVPLRAAVTWCEGLLAAGFGSLLKQRLLHAILNLPIEETRRQGIGQFLGRVLESQAVESLALSGGIFGLLSLIEILVAGGVLAAGASPGWQCASLIVWCGVSGWSALAYVRSRRTWSTERVALTHDTVERMVGHRTRLVQEAPEHRHEQEDQTLSRYLDSSRRMDRAAALLLAGIPRGWVLLGLAALVPVFFMGSAPPEALAISLGGILLALQAFEKFASGAWHLAGSAAAWDQIEPLYRSGAPHPPGALSSRPEPPRAGTPAPAAGAPALLQAHDVVYRYRPGAEPILRGCGIDIFEKDRLILQGPSGSGKSTLAAVLAGLRKPDGGLILSRGLDLPSLGLVEWRRRVALSPQLHENHVFNETLAFNLLMGRRWPPRQEDLEEADSVCRELGLGSLLEKMPSGLQQMVGESGWQLSHGEQSRVFVARALLQQSDLVLLDESLGALDPVTQRQALDCVMRRAPSLLLIAHF